MDFQRLSDAVFRNCPMETVSPVELRDILAELLLQEDAIQGPPEEIGTGLYRMADGEVVGNEPEDLSNY